MKNVGNWVAEERITAPSLTYAEIDQKLANIQLPLDAVTDDDTDRIGIPWTQSGCMVAPTKAPAQPSKHQPPVRAGVPDGANTTTLYILGGLLVVFVGYRYYKSKNRKK
jgi:hypothetical protein